MYNNDRLVAIAHNGFTYNFTYNIWGQLTSVSVGDTTIIVYRYGTGANRDQVVQSIYINGSSSKAITTYEYQNGKIIRVRVNNIVKYEYGYDSLGNVRYINEPNVRTVKYTDGRTEIKYPNRNTPIYSSYTNADGDLVEIINGVKYTSKSYDSEYDIDTGITTEFSDVSSTKGKTIGTVDKQDWFGRYTESIVKTESANDTNTENTFAAVKTEYTYSEYSDNKTSNRVETYVNKVYNGTSTDGDDCTSYTGYSYDYDANGNIIAEYSLNAGGTPSLRYSYVYDELNQLVRTNDAVAQKTYIYTYDGAGNILTKTTYPYTTEELGTATEILNYTYDTTWTDKLMSYGTTSIEYDDIGNPTKIGNENFYWSGRQLETYTQGNKTIEFEYDENGLRHRKTVKENGVITERYDYVWSEGTLVSQTYSTYSNGEVDTTNSAKFIYDGWGTLQGFVLNDTATYLYTKNLQGDILSIVNESGQTVLTYSYDVWGAVTFSATTMQNMMLAYTLSFVSPFTYRGYCYDYDIELYYLQSRYYSAEIGRFINADSTDYLGITGTVLSFNLFSYCENNPVVNVDSNGFASLKYIAFGIQFCISVGKITGGVEVIFQKSNSKWNVYVYLFTGTSTSFESKTNIFSIITNKIKSFKNKTGKLSLKDFFSMNISATLFMILGNNKSSLLGNYSGWFTGISIKIWKGIYLAGAISKNKKTGAIIGSLGISVSTSKRPISFSQTYYVRYTKGSTLTNLINGLRNDIYDKVAFMSALGALLL